MKRPVILIIALCLLAASCGNPQPASTPLASATLPPAPAASQTPTDTLVPATLTATPLLIEGTLTVKVNVRSGPGTQFPSLGQLNGGEKVLISAQDQTGKWYKVLFPSSTDWRGWVTAQFVQVPPGIDIPLPATSTPAGPAGRVIQRLNVRSGPGMTFGSLGMLEPDTTVSLTGKNPTASWFQIEYPSGPGGHGWVTAQYIQTDTASLPILDDYGTPIATDANASTPVSAAITPTVGPAFADNDSQAAPAVRVDFSASGTRQFTYSSQVSVPAGDPEDWVEFTPYTIYGTSARLVFSLTCSGHGLLSVQFHQAGVVLSDWGTLACGDLSKLITLPAAQPILMRVAPVQGEGLQLVDYVLTVVDQP
jgi:uncharacterized protein YraI